MKRWGESNLMECTVLLDSDSAARLERLASDCGTTPEYVAGHILCIAVSATHLRYHGTPTDAYEFDVLEMRVHVSGKTRA